MNDKKPKYLTIADTNNGGDRICFYFGFDESGETVFASKRKLNGITSSKKGGMNEVLAWIGFNNLAWALHNDKKFLKKFKLNVSDVIINELKHVEINSKEVLFFMSTTKDGENWVEIEAIDIKNNFGDQVEVVINSKFGNNYLNKLQISQEKAKQEQIKHNEKINQTRKEMAELQEKISQNVKKETTTEK